MNRWMLYLYTFAMNLSWNLHHLNEERSRTWLIAFVLALTGLLKCSKLIERVRFHIAID